MPGGGRGLDRSGEGRKPAALRPLHPCGRSPCRARIQQLSSEGEIEWLARPFEPEDVPVAISSSRPPTIARSIGPSSKKPRAARSCATPPMIRPCATSSSVPSCSGAPADCYFDGGPESGAGAAAAARDRRATAGGSGPWLDELGQLRREVLQAMPAGAERKALLHELAHREVCGAPAVPREPLPRRRPRNSSERCRSEQGGGGQGLPGGRRARRPGSAYRQGRAPAGLRRAWCCMTTWCPNPSCVWPASRP
jgi:precorrin-2 dehydrogenase/sirohydrochlorin ferrochelatase